MSSRCARTNRLGLPLSRSGAGGQPLSYLVGAHARQPRPAAPDRRTGSGDRIERRRRPGPFGPRRHLPCRADAAERRADAAESRAGATEVRIDTLEARAEVDRELLAELQADGVLAREHVEQLQGALTSSRVVGTALGILMTSRNIGQDEALTVLKGASQRSNTKMRDVAATIVAGADAIR